MPIVQLYKPNCWYSRMAICIFALFIQLSYLSELEQMSTAGETHGLAPSQTCYLRSIL